MTLQTFRLVSLRLVIYCWLVVCYSGPFVSASAPPEKQYFDVPSGLAIITLKEAAQQANVEFLFPAAHVEGVETLQLRGKYTPSEAFSLLLADTPLSVYRHEESGIYTLRGDARESVSNTNPKYANDMNKNKSLFGTLKRGILAITLLPALQAQDGGTETEEELFELSPFEVSASSDSGYRANQTLEGTRFRSQLKDVSAQVDILTKDFLEDIAAIDVEDAFRYSSNVENDAEYISPTAGGGDFNVGVLNVRASNRIRGLTVPGRSRDFFSTNIPRANYNIDRINISSGPNAILFGNSNPGGVVNTGIMRANATKRSGSVSLRVDDYGSFQTTIDYNLPLIENKLAIRFAAMDLRQEYWKNPAYKDDRRYTVAAMFKPFESTVFRGYYEKVDWESIRARNTRPSDKVTPWIAAGRPLYDNSNPDPEVIDWSIFSRDTDDRNLYLYNTIGQTDTYSWGKNRTYKDEEDEDQQQRVSVRTQGPGDAYSGVDRYNYSLPLDESISPIDINLNGNGTRNNMDGEIYGFNFEQKLPGGGYFQVDYNRESVLNPASDMLRGVSAAIYADANMYLPDDNIFTDNPTPNPNAGRLYVQSTGTGRIFLWRGELEEARAQVSYDIDFTENDGWSKWLGRHRFAGMLQRSESMGAQQEVQPRLVPSDWTDEEIMMYWRDGGGPGSLGASRFIRQRVYLDDPKDPNGSVYSFYLDFDPLSTTHMNWADGIDYWAGVDNPYGGHSRPNVTNNRVDSWVFAGQSFFFGNRLVVSYGHRDDSPERAQYSAQRLAGGKSGFERLLLFDVPSDFEDQTPGKTDTLGAVVHVLPWLSGYYNQSSTWNTEYQQIRPDTGVNFPGDIGDGEDYGVMMRFFDNKLSFRVNKYRNTGGPAINNQWRNPIMGAVQDIERIISLAYDEDSPETSQLTSPVAPSAHFDWEQNLFNAYTLVSSQDSSGYELSLTANPTKNWRISVNGSKAEAVYSEIGASWINFIRDRSAVWTQHKELYDYGNLSRTVGSEYSTLIANLNTMLQSDGQSIESGRSKRANLVTRYSFTDGKLKGAFVGGGYRWRAKRVIGYAATTVDNAFPFEGAEEQYIVPALDSPIFGDATTEVEAFLGYGMKLGDKVDWKVQLNIRNLFDDTDVVPQRANLTDGFVTIYRLQQPRSFILTNTFSF